MRYFLDTEYNGVGGELLSLALVPDDGDELYLTLRHSDSLVQWVERHVGPYLDSVPEQLTCPRLTRKDAAHALERGAGVVAQVAARAAIERDGGR